MSKSTYYLFNYAGYDDSEAMDRKKSLIQIQMGFAFMGEEI